MPFISSMCRNLWAKMRMKKVGLAILAVLCRREGPRTVNDDPCSVLSPQGMVTLIFSVLRSIRIPAGALIAYVA